MGTPISLGLEDCFQFFLFHPVIDESVVPDLLETGGKHMYQETVVEIFVAKSGSPFRITCFPSCRESNFYFCNR